MKTIYVPADVNFVCLWASLDSIESHSCNSGQALLCQGSTEHPELILTARQKFKSSCFASIVNDLSHQAAELAGWPACELLAKVFRLLMTAEPEPPLLKDQKER